MSSEATQRKKANKELHNLCRTYHTGLPIREVMDILKANGFNEKTMEGIYCGEKGKLHEQVGKNTWIVFEWYKMPSSGKYEINAYVS